MNVRNTRVKLTARLQNRLTVSIPPFEEVELSNSGFTWECDGKVTGMHESACPMADFHRKLRELSPGGGLFDATVVEGKLAMENGTWTLMGAHIRLHLILRTF